MQILEWLKCGSPYMEGEWRKGGIVEIAPSLEFCVACWT